MFKQILIGFKFTPASRLALAKGLELAQWHSAEATILHVLDYSLQDLEPNDPKRIAEIEKARDGFEAEMKALPKSTAGIEFEAYPGDPAMAICKKARRTGADLIVLGCHQPSSQKGLARVDYVGLTILEIAPCPVILIPFFG